MSAFEVKNVRKRSSASISLPVPIFRRLTAVRASTTGHCGGFKGRCRAIQEKMSLKTLTAATFRRARSAFAPLAHADIVIGLIAPLTGPIAAYGDQVKMAHRPPSTKSTRAAAFSVRK